jgi:hypothetical protein
MRTKTLLAAAAMIAAGALSLQAQNNVYSLNVVGYVNVVCSNGFTMVNNPLVQPNSSVGVLLADDQNGGTIPAGVTIFPYINGAYVPNINDEFGGGWSNPGQVITNGQGFFFLNPNPTPTTITFVGEVPQGALSSAFTPGFTMLGSKAPEAGFIENLGLVAPDGDTVFRYKAGAYQTYIKDEFGGGWSGSDSDFDAVKGPNLKVGEAMFYYRSDINGAPTWNRNFTVQ